MALIRATCRECGDVELSSCDVQVRVCEDTREATFLFRCPICRMVEVREADQQVVDILVCAGCKSSSWRLPKELTERPKAGPAITHDDLIDFHADLIGGDGENWMRELRLLLDHDAM